MKQETAARSLRALLAGLYGFASIAAITAAAAPVTAAAQEEDGEDEEDDDDEPETIADKTEDFETFEGLFPLYQDPEDGTLYMEVTSDQLGQEFIAYSVTENGVLGAGHFRGNYRDQRIVSFEKRYGTLDVVEKNTSFYYDPASALARAAEANVTDAVLANVDIEAETPASGETPARYLIKADDLFLKEVLHQVKASSGPNDSPSDFKIGELSSSKTHYDAIRNYPENSDFVIDYVFDLPRPTNYGGADVTDARSVTIKMQHTLLAMPEEGYTPRFDDWRVGYFTDEVTDLTTVDETPYRDLVNRWRLVKQDPSAAVSDPVEPITWWIENTTPVEYRDTIAKAVLAWNEAFEKAGFSNAMAVEVQPDDAEWDAGDIRYNVLRWTSSPNPPFGGYGPSFTNPRTGEILASDVMLEYVFLTNRIDYTKLFETAGLEAQEETGGLHGPHGKHFACSFSSQLQQDLMFARTAAMQAGVGEDEISALVEDGLYYLILHEVGHTLGLNHNMKASVMWGPKEVHDASVTQGIIAGSVMDYPALNVAPVGMEQGDYANSRPGPYDDWAITFGYSPEMDDPAAREALLARSTEHGLEFGNDADDMRSAGGGGIDPRVMIGDMSNDMVTYGRDRIDLVQALMPTLKEKYGGEDAESWEELLNAYFVLTSNQANMGASVSRYIGGVYVERAAPGQDGATQSYTPVPKAEQKRAMKMLKETIFAADAFEVPPELAASLQPQRRGFDFFGGTEDPKIHERALSIQSAVLNHLTSTTVMGRMTNYQTYGGDYTPAEMLLDLNDAIYGGELTGNPNTFRQNLQIAYTQRLVAMATMPWYDAVSRSAALAAIKDVNGRVGFFALGQNPQAAAHRDQVKRLIKPVLDPS